MPPVGLEPTISAGERPQTYTLDHAATGTPTTYRIQIKPVRMSVSLEKLMAIESGYFHYGLVDDDSSSMMICFVLIKVSTSILYVHCKF
jgi:hypothetical protein